MIGETNEIQLVSSSIEIFQSTISNFLRKSCKSIVLHAAQSATPRAQVGLDVPQILLVLSG